MVYANIVTVLYCIIIIILYYARSCDMTYYCMHLIFNILGLLIMTCIDCKRIDPPAANPPEQYYSLDYIFSSGQTQLCFSNTERVFGGR